MIEAINQNEPFSINPGNTSATEHIEYGWTKKNKK